MTVWQGKAYCLFFTITGSTDDALAILDALDIEEDEHGIWIDAKHGKGHRVTNPVVYKEIPRLGLLRMTAEIGLEPPRRPAGRGLQVRGGELFVDKKDVNNSSFLLAGNGVTSQITPFDGVDSPAILDAIGALEIGSDPLASR